MRTGLNSKNLCAQDLWANCNDSWCKLFQFNQNCIMKRHIYIPMTRMVPSFFMNQYAGKIYSCHVFARNRC